MTLVSKFPFHHFRNKEKLGSKGPLGVINILGIAEPWSIKLKL